MKKLTTIILSTFFSFLALPVFAQNRPPVQNYNYSQANANINWCDSYSESIRNAQSSGRPLLILFTGTNWCPACMKLEREVLNKPEFARAVNDKFVFYKAEFPEADEESMMNSPDKVLVDRYQIVQFPTIVVVDGNGRQLFTVNYKAAGPSAYANELNQKLQSLNNRR